VGDKLTVTSNKPYLLRAIHEWILDNDLTPHLLVNALVSNVEVPQKFVQNDQIILNIAPHAISSLLMDNEAVSFSARFSGVSESIYIPVQAIRAIYASENGEGLSFPEEFIEEVLEQEKPETQPEAELEPEQDTSEAPKKSNKKAPFLKVIK